jgi:hypothetical protein
MNGVEILAVEQVGVAFKYNCDALLLLIIIGAAIGLVMGLIYALTEGEWIYFVVSVVLGLVFGTICGALIGAADAIPTEYVNQYKVTISDEVSMNEFNEKYEIIDQEGKIYTVRERENES